MGLKNDTSTYNSINGGLRTLPEQELKIKQLEHRLGVFNSKASEQRVIDNFYYFLVSLGTIISFFGFYLWYYRFQNYQDKIIKADVFLKGIVHDDCQSCGIDFLINNLSRGKDANGLESKMFCNYCYKDGSYIEPELTLELMKIKLEKRLSELRFNVVFKWYSLWKLKGLARWKRNFYW